MLAAVAGQVMSDTSSRRPPQVAQASTSMAKVRRMRPAQVQKPLEVAFVGDHVGP